MVRDFQSTPTVQQKLGTVGGADSSRTSGAPPPHTQTQNSTHATDHIQSTFTHTARKKISRQVERERDRRREGVQFQADRHIPTHRTRIKKDRGKWEKKKECVTIIVVIELKLQ